MADESVDVRSVKLKVHYTFDIEHKNDHLTKPPQSFSVQTAAIDETTTIGIIDLRTCLEVVFNSSPELTSTDENDFTVYAYDYSEPNTPLVGQGKLSKIMSQDVGDDSENEAMVTGKITKNLMGMFSKNAQPFLEVRLRFTPVASSYQRGRSGSVSSASGGMQPQWNNSQNNGFSDRPQSPANTSGLEVMQRMLSEGGPARERRGSVQPDSFYQGNMSRPSSRPGTPTQQSQPYYNQSSRFPPLQPRPSSQAGSRQNSHARRESFNSGYYSGEENMEEGPARKRARIKKVDTLSKSDFNIERQPDSLRVMASSASSVRLHRPTPVNPTMALQQGLSAEEPIRPPTPIPKVGTKTGRPRGRPRKHPKPYSELDSQRGSSPGPDHTAQSQVPDVSMSSPEETRHNLPQESTNSTPMDLPSSPPMMPDQPSFVTSPVLPALHRDHVDSGFMSGDFDDFFGNGNDLDFAEFLNDKNDMQGLQIDQQQIDNTTNQPYPPVFEEDSSVEGPTPQPQSQMQTHPTPTTIPTLPPNPPRQLTRAQSVNVPPQRDTNISLMPKPVRSAPTLLPRPRPLPEFSHGQNILPPVPASDPVGRTFQRSNTWAPDMSDAIMSDAITSTDPNRPRPKKRVGREQTQARLDSAIAAGQMPPFCDNCGTIQTPAWRRGFIKIFDCSVEDIGQSLVPGECCYKEPFEYHPDGRVKKWKGYKVEKSSNDKSDDWQQINLCNPCGLWFHKSKYPRPPEKWQKKDPKEKRKRKRPPKPPKSRSNPPRGLTGSLQSDAPTPASDESSPANTSAEGQDGDESGENMNFLDDETGDDGEPQLPPMPVRASSAEPILIARQPAKHLPIPRLVQSSPAGHGTAMEPIMLDLTPKPLRRVLFPSPANKQNSAVNFVVLKEKTNETLLPSFVRRSPRLNKVRDVFAENSNTVTVSVNGEGKENMTPRLGNHDDDGLGDLFGDIDGDEDGHMLPPATPTPKRRSERILNKTPGREFGTAISGNAQLSPISALMKTPKIGNLASVFLESAQKGLDPKHMTPFTRSIHEALDNNNFVFNPQTPKSASKRHTRSTPRKVISAAKSSMSIDNIFDFPDLPSLKNSSPMSTTLAGETFTAIGFSELTTDRLQTTDHDFDQMFSTDAVGMPSSPPTGFFDFLNTSHSTASHKAITSHEEAHSGDAIWNEIDFSICGNNESTLEFQTPKKKKVNGLLSVPSTPNTLRRSPRRLGTAATQEQQSQSLGQENELEH